MNIVERAATAVRTQFLKAVNEQCLNKFTDCYNVTSKPGVATLIEPINGDPYVVTFGGGEQAHLTIFESAPGSGTDKMRCRMHAKQFYLSIQPREAQ